MGLIPSLWHPQLRYYWELYPVLGILNLDIMRTYTRSLVPSTHLMGNLDPISSYPRLGLELVSPRADAGLAQNAHGYRCQVNGKSGFAAWVSFHHALPKKALLRERTCSYPQAASMGWDGWEYHHFLGATSLRPSSLTPGRPSRDSRIVSEHEAVGTTTRTFLKALAPRDVWATSTSLVKAKRTFCFTGKISAQWANAGN